MGSVVDTKLFSVPHHFVLVLMGTHLAVTETPAARWFAVVKMINFL